MSDNSVTSADTDSNHSTAHSWWMTVSTRISGWFSFMDPHTRALQAAQLAEHTLLSRLAFFRSNLMAADDPQLNRYAWLRHQLELYRQGKISSADDLSPRSDPSSKSGGHELELGVLDLKLFTPPAINEHAAAWTQDVDLQHGDEVIHTFVMDTDGDTRFPLPVEEHAQKPTLVMCHGYGAGLAMWYRNYPLLSRMQGWRVYSIDWLGMGCSSRIHLPKRQPDQTESQDIDQVEQYFVESLERWRQKCHVGKMTLMGHSLGGYLSIAYALKYPEHVEKLILVSPAGINERPANMEQRIKTQFSTTQRRFLSAMTYLWEKNVTPQGIVRATGLVLGDRLVRGYVTRRFNLNGRDVEDMTNYVHAITKLVGTGEYALSRLLSPGGWARRPFQHRLEELKMPAVFLYGEYDFMDPTVPAKMAHCLQPGSKVIIVPNSGHQLMIENPWYFTRKVLRELGWHHEDRSSTDPASPVSETT